MENIIASLNSVLPLFLIMLIGHLLKRFGLYTKESVKIFNGVVFKIMLPLHLFHNISMGSSKDRINLVYLAYIVISIVIVFIGGVIYSLMCEPVERRGVTIQGIFRSNFIILGLPVAQLLYGDMGGKKIALVTAVVIPLFTILAVISFTAFQGKKVELRKIILGIIKNPLTIGCVAGILFSVLNIKLPFFLKETISQLAKTATPLAVLLLGASLESKKIGNNFFKILKIATVKLVLIPTIFVGIGVFLDFRGIELIMAYIIFGGPVAVSSFTMAEVMGGDAELAGQIVVITTVASVVTMFLGILIMKNFNLL